MDKQKSPKELVIRLARGGVIGAIYAALTILLAPISFGAVQFRIAEGMCVLPVFFPEAIPGLFIGCIIANIFSPNVVILDVIFGSLATLISALITRRIRIKWLVPLPSVLLNAIIISPVIAFSVTTGVGGQDFLPVCLYNLLTVGLGQLVTCYAIGLPLMAVIKKMKNSNLFDRP